MASLRRGRYSRPVVKHPSRGRVAAGRAFAVAAAGLALLAGKAKWVFAASKFFKFPALAAMVLGIAAYGEALGAQYWLGLAVVVVVHEGGHVLARRQLGMPVGPGAWVPVFGVALAERADRAERDDDEDGDEDAVDGAPAPDDLGRRAVVRLAGPAAGLAFGGLCAAVAAGTGSDLAAALAVAGFVWNLLALLPLPLTDGGAAGRAFGLWPSLAALSAAGVGFVLTGAPSLVVFGLLGAFAVWKARKPTPGLPPARVRWALAATACALCAIALLGAHYAPGLATDLGAEDRVQQWLPALQRALGR